MFKKTVIAGLALTAALASGWAASASPSATTVEGFKSQKISYGDLDLSRDSDAQKLIVRIHEAAVYLCSIPGDTGLDRMTRSYHSCVRNASANAVAALHNGMVTAAWEGQPNYQVANK